MCFNYKRETLCYLHFWGQTLHKYIFYIFYYYIAFGKSLGGGECVQKGILDMYSTGNKTGLQPVLGPVEQIIGFSKSFKNSKNSDDTIKV